MNIMFTGHRDKIASDDVMNNIAALYSECVWFHGGANGFDSQVESFANLKGIITKIIKPNYEKHHPKQAPLIRNVEMINNCDVVIACYDGRKKGGTFFSINAAKKAGKKVVIIQALHHHKSTQQE